jgi:hypothetical protein
MTTRAARAIALAALVAAAALLSGCASPERERDVERARTLKRQAMLARLLAGAVASELGDEAVRMEESRGGGRRDAAETSFQRLSDGRVVLEAIEDAENSLALSARYHEVRADLDLPPRVLARLDRTVERIVEVASTITGERVKRFVPVAGKACDPKTAEALKNDLERDRAALRAWRIDIGLIMQLGGGGE